MFTQLGCCHIAHTIVLSDIAAYSRLLLLNRCMAHQWCSGGAPNTCAYPVQSSFSTAACLQAIAEDPSWLLVLLMLYQQET